MSAGKDIDEDIFAAFIGAKDFSAGETTASRQPTEAMLGEYKSYICANVNSLTHDDKVAICKELTSDESQFQEGVDCVMIDLDTVPRENIRRAYTSLTFMLEKYQIK